MTNTTIHLLRKIWQYRLLIFKIVPFVFNQRIWTEILHEVSTHYYLAKSVILFIKWLTKRNFCKLLTFAYQWVWSTVLFVAFRTSSKVLNVDPCFGAQTFSLRESGLHAVLAHFFVKIAIKIQTFLVNLNFFELLWVCFDICYDFLLRLNFRQSCQILKLVKKANFICQSKFIRKMSFFQSQNYSFRVCITVYNYQ